MLELMLKLTAVGVVGAFFSLLLRDRVPEQALLVAVTSALVVLLLLGDAFDQWFSYLDRLMDASGLSREILAPLLKTVGISILCKFGGDLCREAGAKAAAGGIELGGTLLCLLLSMPLLMSLLNLLEEMMA